MNRNNEIALVSADAFVMYYDSIFGKWVASGLSRSVTIAKVQLLRNVSSNQFRIFAWNPINREVLANSVVYHDLRFQKAHATFHEWRDADTQLVYGLHFADPKDAALFGDVISRVFKSLDTIYQECQALQSQIRSTSSSEHYHQSWSNDGPNDLNPFITEHSSDSRIRQCSSGNNIDYFVNKVDQNMSRQISRTTSKSPPTNLTARSYASMSYEPNVLFNNEFERQSPHNYENIDDILADQAALTAFTATNIELSNKCQSSSDDSVRGLKKQPSSSSSGYATVASLVDPISAFPNATPSSSRMPKTDIDSKPKNPNGQLAKAESVASATPSLSSDSQLQTSIKLRKRDNSLPRYSFLLNQTKSDTGVRSPDRVSESASRESRVPLTDNIMSEMKKILQRRKRLINGHTDPNYSSSTEKSDAYSSSASDAGSFVGTFDKTLDRNKSPHKRCGADTEGLNRETRISDQSLDNKSHLEDKERPDSQQRYLKDLSHNKKCNTIETFANLTFTTIIASKHDLHRIRKEITENLRQEFMETKKEVIDAIRLMRNVIQ